MPRLSKRERAIRQMQAAAQVEESPEYSDFERYLKCPKKLHAASAAIAQASLELAGGRHSAFTAQTRTPLPAPPGWLPPPI